MELQHKDVSGEADSPPKFWKRLLSADNATHRFHKAIMSLLSGTPTNEEFTPQEGMSVLETSLSELEYAITEINKAADSLAKFYSLERVKVKRKKPNRNINQLLDT